MFHFFPIPVDKDFWNLKDIRIFEGNTWIGNRLVKLRKLEKKTGWGSNLFNFTFDLLINLSNE